ncbi:hypothetical protein ACFQE1_03895 [Halobium palmae]|uniref:Uncharacterized protein n=1 Tax=Halobium palmae TaxID=1776492 RepID=A0ABD5RWA7_9EURY
MRRTLDGRFHRPYYSSNASELREAAPAETALRELALGMWDDPETVTARRSLHPKAVLRTDSPSTPREIASLSQPTLRAARG